MTSANNRDSQVEYNKVSKLHQLYQKWINIPEAEWTSVWRDSALLNEIREGYLALSDEDQQAFAKQHLGLEFHKLYYPDGSVEVMVRDTTYQ